MVGPHVLPMANFTSFRIHWFFFFLRERHKQGWFCLMETLDHLPAAPSPVRERGPRCHQVTPGAEHWGRQSLQDAAAQLASARGAGDVSSSSKLLSSAPSPQGSEKREHSSFSLSSLYQLQPLPLTLPFLQVGNLKACPQHKIKLSDLQPDKGTMVGDSLKWYFFLSL